MVAVIIPAVMRVLVYGAGSVGLGLGSFLLKAGADVTFIARPQTVDALKQAGLVRTGIFGDFQAGPDSFTAVERLGKLGPGPFDYILVCTKSFDSAFAAEDLAGHPEVFARGTKIVLCQNGWGNAEKFTAHFPPQRVYSARVITGFTRHGPNEVEVTVHADAIHIGSLFDCALPAVEPLAAAIADGDIPCVTVPNIEKDLWAKMLYNCALNPLGAILDVPYGALAENELTRELMNRLSGEAFAVMSAAGYETHWSSSADFLDAFYGKMLPPTAGHNSSMLQDIKAGKKTEIDALTGAALALAGRDKMEIPYSRVIYCLVKYMESRHI